MVLVEAFDKRRVIDGRLQILYKDQCYYVGYAHEATNIGESSDESLRGPYHRLSGLIHLNIDPDERVESPGRVGHPLGYLIIDLRLYKTILGPRSNEHAVVPDHVVLTDHHVVVLAAVESCRQSIRLQISLDRLLAEIIFLEVGILDDQVKINVGGNSHNFCEGFALLRAIISLVQNALVAAPRCHLDKISCLSRKTSVDLVRKVLWTLIPILQVKVVNRIVGETQPWNVARGQGAPYLGLVEVNRSVGLSDPRVVVLRHAQIDILVDVWNYPGLKGTGDIVQLDADVEIVKSQVQH